jgi:arylsulfatase A-like enzyme
MSLRTLAERLTRGNVRRGPRSALFAMLVVALALLAVLALRGRPGGRDGRPNVLLVTVEATRADHCSLYGYERQTTPFLGELARESIVFDNAWSASSWTKPSIASIFTGQYPSEHGVVRTTAALPDSAYTLAERLHDAGYFTLGFATSTPIAPPEFCFSQGFDIFVECGQPRAADLFATVLSDLEAARPPWFCWVHVYDPHSAYDAPQPWRDKWRDGYAGPLLNWPIVDAPTLRDADNAGELSEADRAYALARYDAEIRYTDECLRAFVRQCRTRGLWQHTVLVLTADHGESLGETVSEIKHWAHSGPVSPGLCHVPLLIRLPELRTARVAEPVGCADLLPTVLALAGAPAAPGTHGRDLLRDPDRRPVLCEWFKQTDNPDAVVLWARGVVQGTALLTVEGYQDGSCIARRHENGRRYTADLEDVGRVVNAAAPWPVALPDHDAAAASERTLRELRDLGYL